MASTNTMRLCIFQCTGHHADQGQRSNTKHLSTNKQVMYYLPQVQASNGGQEDHAKMHAV
jgi:hypothetical protein